MRTHLDYTYETRTEPLPFRKKKHCCGCSGAYILLTDSSALLLVDRASLLLLNAIAIAATVDDGAVIGRDSGTSTPRAIQRSRDSAPRFSGGFRNWRAFKYRLVQGR